jgi:hypothetical protein
MFVGKDTRERLRAQAEHLDQVMAAGDPAAVDFLVHGF